MDNEQIKAMDPNILVSIINMKLRDFYDSLEGLCDDMDISREVLENKMISAGYKYVKANNQFIG
ncbi:DUF4250 domain-containing protein [Clostridium sp. C8-1-8]|uniref:DUF4250 domain-containing protein n=1 Tax=Clostridium sp. C8-1-8 TaxID=2698831 RepID=UPI0013693A79|nr:DUF4250 domain-containing protein [Clostridium sp. C8-1-8]